MTKFEAAKAKAKLLAEEIKKLGPDFEVNVDDDGGYIELDGITFNLDSDMNITDAELTL